MGIWINEDMPVVEQLLKENIAWEPAAQPVKPGKKRLSIVVVNLMPLKEATELQLLRLLANSSVDTAVTFLHMESHHSRNVSREYLRMYYKTLKEIRDEQFDGMIITGAPVEQLGFTEVDYWEELTGIMDWSTRHVTSTMFLCWAAQAALYHFHGIDKYPLERKLSGIFTHRVTGKEALLTRGFDDEFYAPHSRHTYIPKESIEKQSELEILSESPEAGVYLIFSANRRRVYITGHPEYDRVTLADEYHRDRKKQLDPVLPENYFPEDDPARRPLSRWASHADLLFANWLNHYVS